jgi:hypothetical protein
MTGDKSLFVDPNLTTSSQKYITFDDNNKGKVLGLGKIAISNDKSFDDVLLVQSLGFNLMPVGKLCDLGMLVLFSISKCIVFMASDNSFIFEGIRKGDLYIVDFSKGPTVQTCLLAKATEGWQWHRRLGHAGMRNLQTLVRKNHLRGIPDVKFDKDRLCGACEAGKLAKKHHSSKTVMTTTRPLEILHMDLVGPHNYSSFDGSYYGLVIVDDFSWYTWVFFLEDKTCTQDIVKRFTKKAQNVCALNMLEVIMALS